MTDFNKLAKDEFDKLNQDLNSKQTEISNIKERIAPLKAFLQKAGVIETKKRATKVKDRDGSV